MFFKNVAVEAVAYELAPHRISSSDIEAQLAETMSRLGIQPGHLEGLTGIGERRFWDPGVKPSEVATLAARKVIDQSGIDPMRIGCLINSSVCKDYIEPSMACMVHGNLNLPATCLNYDIGNACLGFMNAMVHIGLMIDNGLIEYGLIVNGEGSREAIEATIARLQHPGADEKMFRNNFATLTLGSGAVAMILGKRTDASSNAVKGEVTLADTRHCRLCVAQPDEMIADAHAVLINGVALACKTWELASQTLENWNDQNLDVYVPHQVSNRNTMALNQQLNLTADKFMLNFPFLGNIGPAAVAISLGMALETDRIQSGSHVGMLGIGSGLNCTMMSIQY